MGKIVVFIGPSGSGKSSFAEYLIHNHNAVKIVSTTSREPRMGEKDAIQYHFRTKEIFEDMIAKNELLEYANYSGNYYGISKTEISKKLNSANLVVAVMEIGGALKVKSMFPATEIIYCHADIDCLMQRMYDRGDSFENIKKRVKFYFDEKEYENANKADFIIDNNGSPNVSYVQLETYLGI